MYSFFFASIDDVFWGHTKEACFFVFGDLPKKNKRNVAFLIQFLVHLIWQALNWQSVEGCCLMANGSDLPKEYFAKFFAYSAYWICCPPRHFLQLQKPKTISLIAYLSAKLVAMTAAVFTLWHKNNMCFCTERNIQLNIFCLARQRESFKVPFSRFKNAECFPYLKFKASLH